MPHRVIRLIASRGMQLSLSGGAENTGPENDGPSHRGWKMQDSNMTYQMARPENAGPEDDGPHKPNITNELNHWSTVPVEMMKFKQELEFLVNLLTI